MTAKFVVDEGYEPPQGVLQIVSDDAALFVEGGLNRWTLEVGFQSFRTHIFQSTIFFFSSVFLVPSKLLTATI